MSRNKLHVSFFPAGGVEVASSRIRVYQLQSILAKRGIATTFGFSLSANVLLFQKKVTRENLWQARIAKAMGRLIIYDVDDFGDALWYYVPEKNFKEILKLADIVITCSDEQKKYLISRFNAGNVAVVPTAIDYFPHGPIKLKDKGDRPLRIIWFGSGSNIHLLERYIGALSCVPNSELYVVMGGHDLGGYRDKYPSDSITFVSWALCDFISLLQSCDLACLMHDGTVEDMAKGNNKMIAAITWGVPAVVSRTPEYERTACESGIDYAVFSNENELLDVIEKLRPIGARNLYLETAQKLIWDRYSPDVIAQQYLDIANRALENKRRRSFLP